MGKYAAMAATRVKRRAELNDKRVAEGLEPISSKDYSKMNPLPWEKTDKGDSVDLETKEPDDSNVSNTGVSSKAASAYDKLKAYVDAKYGSNTKESDGMSGPEL